MTSNNSDTNNINYMNSRPLDVHTWSDYSEVNDFVDDIYLLLKSIKGHKKGNKRLLKVLLLDLYVAWCADPDLKIMFSRDNNAYKAKSRYNELHISKKIRGIVDVLVAEGIVYEKQGFNDRVRGVAFQSRLWATDGLIEQFKAARFSQFQIHSHEAREPVVLRDKAKKDIEDLFYKYKAISVKTNGKHQQGEYVSSEIPDGKRGLLMAHLGGKSNLIKL